jgi:hypothetical protein
LLHIKCKHYNFILKKYFHDTYQINFGDTRYNWRYSW